MAFLAKLFGKKKDNTPAEEALGEEEEGLTPEEEAAAEAAEAALLNGDMTTVEEPVVEEPVVEEPVVEEPIVEKPVVEEPVVEEPVIEEPVIEESVVEEPVIEEPVMEEPAEEEIEETATKKSFWGRLKSGLTKTRTALFSPVDNLLKAFTKVDEDLLEELEEILISADVGFTATEEIMEELRERIKDGRLKEKEQVMSALREIMTDMIGESEPLHLDTTPSVLLVIDVNGAGKTTSIGKISKRLRLQGKKVVVAAGDTFRAAAIDQLAVWCERARVDMVKQSEGSDPAAVVFDAIAVAKKKQADVLIIDTAGRLQNKKNLMNELAKIDRVIDRELPGAARETLLVLDATTGQNAVSQAKEFGSSAKITGITLNKLDGTAKGGIVISIKRELGIPVKFIGVGEKIDDMQEFDAEDFVKALFGE
ncbi:MAG: signal recognition particle-docking protein FtsY [Clostridia bacterium]|nr:signal recognition particle-docking protein FtsY [Clostridia bacterium]